MKRFTVTNRGSSTQAQKENRVAIRKVVDRYSKKTGKKYSIKSEGNSFLRYEAYAESE